ncbi:PIR protein [Plasmodium ovale]|uniref:PIR Superfamily Protein n=2 Tax=Plasmodium ovale TaxID=36330 RepID=A0A1A8WPF3_PLAOA|nr:PIR Superfamily Protein [Plasmodium ovale curtisi]SBT84221.1 PIR protein [Plasmodium ovale]
MDISACPADYKKIKGSPEYFYEIFNKTRSDFSNVKQQYIDIIKSYSDPYLQHVALYLIENYLEVKHHLVKDSRYSKNVACNNLNRWFDERKNLFTFSEKCKTKNIHWEIQIEDLWKRIQEEDPEHTCQRYKVFTNTANFPDDLKNPICYKSVPENCECSSPKPDVVSTVENSCPKCEKSIMPANCPTFDTSFIPSQAQIQERSESCSSALPTMAISLGSILMGTVVILFCLYKFTPLISWLYNRKINNRRNTQYFMKDESFGSYERYPENAYAQLNNERNYLLYHSS